MGFLNLKCLGITSLRTRTKRNKSRDITEDDVGRGVGVGSSYNIIRKFSWDEMERLTMNFSSSRVIGSGGFSTVYLADLIPSTTTSTTHRSLAAIKIINGSRLFKQELDILAQLHHRNIVNLIGYSDDRDDRGGLVLEYVPNGSLQEKLHHIHQLEGEGLQLLSWKNRMEIALQVAEALEYLHEKCALPIVHGDIKPSNLLLDQRLNCRLCDFGSATMGSSSTVASPSPSPSGGSRIKRLLLIGSPGYTDPHYLRTGIPSKKNDVYSFGVVLLELVTGTEGAQAQTTQSQAQLLTSVVGLGPMLRDIDNCEAPKVAEMVDPRLAGNFDLEEARAMLSLSVHCLHQPPTLRPSASQILRTINDNMISSVSKSNPPPTPSTGQKYA